MVEGVVWVEAVEDQGEEEGEDAEQVDHVQEGEQELPLEKIRYLFALAGIEIIVSHAKLTHCYCKGSSLKIQIQAGIAQITIWPTRPHFGTLGTYFLLFSWLEQNLL